MNKFVAIVIVILTLAGVGIGIFSMFDKDEGNKQ